MPVTDFEVNALDGAFSIEIDDPLDHGNYIVGLRRLGKNTFDTTYLTSEKVDTFSVKEPFWYYINVATIDDSGVQSLFCLEKDVRIRTTGLEDFVESRGITLLQNAPNPFDEATTIAVAVDKVINYNKAEIRIIDRKGSELIRLPIELKVGNNEVMYSYESHGFAPGVYHYGLWIDDVHFQTKSMIYAY
jgi:hypothetical protein